MKAEELRIGNLVNVDEKAYKISGGDLYNLENYSKNYGHLYKPIPLTEKWLLKFGFDKEIRSELWFRPDFWVQEMLLLPGSFYHNGLEIKYVHQLQNLYFALTGEELEQQLKQLSNTCTCGRREINTLSGICDECWNEMYPDEKVELKD